MTKPSPLCVNMSKTKNLVKHMLCVEAAMRFYAEKFGEDVETWGLLGLIHDFDWEIHPTLEEHPTKGAPILRERGVDEDIIQDILSHGVGTGVPRDTLRRKALYAVRRDHRPGDRRRAGAALPFAARPGGQVGQKEVERQSLRRRDRPREMEESAEEFGVDLWEHVGNVILAMRKIAPELGLVGNVQ